MALTKKSIFTAIAFVVLGTAIGFFAASRMNCRVPAASVGMTDAPSSSLTTMPAFETAGTDALTPAQALPTPPSSSPALNPAPRVTDAASAPGLESYFKSLDDSNSSVYVVKPGDNLTKISQSQGVTVGQILAASGLSDPNKLQIGMKLKIMKDKWDVIVDKSTYTLYLRAAGKTIQTYKIGTGKDNSTPAGSFTIVNRLKNPTWYHEGVVAPYGDPKNPLGTRWMGFDVKGYGLHGTIEPETIGKSESMGCVRMLNADVETLFELLPVGTRVTVAEKLESA